MKKLLAAVSMICVASAAASQPLHAQVGFGVAAGPSIPVGSLADAFNTGVHGGVVLDVGLPLLPLGIRGDLMYHHMPGVADGVSFRQVVGTANARFSLLPLPLVSAYLTAGAGLYAGDVNIDGTDSDWSTNGGINAGVGARINLLVVRPFLEARLHRVFGDGSYSFVPITLGIFF